MSEIREDQPLDDAAAAEDVEGNRMKRPSLEDSDDVEGNRMKRPSLEDSDDVEGNRMKRP